MTTNSVQIPPGLVIARQLPDLMLPAKVRRGVLGFLRNNPTVAIGGVLLLCLILIGIFAPYLGTVDPTALAHKAGVESETTEPREAYAPFPDAAPASFSEDYLPAVSPPKARRSWR